jgi:hypothetical protein
MREAGLGKQLIPSLGPEAYDSLAAQTVALEHINGWLHCGIRIRSGCITVLGTCSLVWAQPGT